MSTAERTFELGSVIVRVYPNRRITVTRRGYADGRIQEYHNFQLSDLANAIHLLRIAMEYKGAEKVITDEKISYEVSRDAGC